MGVQAKSSVLDVEGTLARFGGDVELFREMAAMLLEDAPGLAEELGAAVSTENASAIQMKAHALKGLVIGCGGVRAGQAAQKLEDSGRDQRLDHAAEQLADLQKELQILFDAIRNYHA